MYLAQTYAKATRLIADATRAHGTKLARAHNSARANRSRHKMTAVIQNNFFDYAALDSETRIVVQQRTSEIKALMKRAASDIIDIGQKLIEVKARLGHGYFGGWLASEFDWGDRTARQFMMVADRFKSANFADLQIAPSALYLLAAPSTPEDVRSEAIARAEQGETITYSTARDLIEDAQEARRYDGFAKVVPPEEDEEPLSEYEEQIARQYAPAMSQPMSILTSQGTIEWYTPPDLIERARALMSRIDLDPASNDIAQRWIRAAAYHTAATPNDTPWTGRVWLNPPFDDTPAWVDRLDSEYIHGDVTEAVLLVNSAPGYIWWENLWRRRPVCMLRERVCFYQANGTANGPAKKGTTIAYYGENTESFIAHFGDIGRVILPED